MVKTFPSLKDLEQIKGKIKKIPNQKGEYLRKTHYGCYLLCSQSGLRISEAVSFDLDNKARQGLYRIEKPKGKKERLVYVNKEVVKELKKNNWQPNQTNRHNFYHFLKKVKQKANINQNVELTPHTLRRTFATYHAEAGLPLPLLQKLLGHSSIRTTALYWQNIYGEDDPSDILASKKWLENKEPPKPSPSRENFPEQLPKNIEPAIIREKPLITAKRPFIKLNPPPLTKIEKKPVIINYQPISQISPKTPEKFFLNTSEKLPLITNREQPTNKEQILLAKIKILEEQLKQTQTKNNNLTNQLAKSDQEKKELAVKLANSEKLNQSETQRANYYQQQLKTIAKSLYQWQKINYYQQLEQGRKELKAQIEQPPPWKPNK